MFVAIKTIEYSFVQMQRQIELLKGYLSVVTAVGAAATVCKAYQGPFIPPIFANCQNKPVLLKNDISSIYPPEQVNPTMA
jgi:hypothetical protein